MKDVRTLGREGASSNAGKSGRGERGLAVSKHPFQYDPR